MKLIEIVCKNCGASLKVEDNRSKKITCEYCGANFFLDDDTSVVKHVMAGQITEEQEYINAETNLNKFKDYNASLAGYLSLSERFVDNKEVWIGLLRSYTHDFTLDYSSSYFKADCEKYFNKFSALASEKEVEEYEEKYRTYLKEHYKKDGTGYGGDIYEVKSLKDNSLAMLLIIILLGEFGVHKFIQKKYVMGVVYLCTFGLFGIGWMVDFVLAVVKLVKDSN